jgi:hypothetical protein
MCRVASSLSQPRTPLLCMPVRAASAYHVPTGSAPSLSSSSTAALAGTATPSHRNEHHGFSLTSCCSPQSEATGQRDCSTNCNGRACRGQPTSATLQALRHHHRLHLVPALLTDHLVDSLHEWSTPSQPFPFSRRAPPWTTLLR